MTIPYVLTDQVYKFVLKTFDATGYPPSNQAIMEHCKLSAYAVDRALLFLRAMEKLDGRIPAERIARKQA